MLQKYKIVSIHANHLGKNRGGSTWETVTLPDGKYLLKESLQQLLSEQFFMSIFVGRYRQGDVLGVNLNIKPKR